MQITRPLYSLIHSISRRTGLFTRRQCVDVAARVGKELVDMQKAGIKIDRNSCMYAVKKYVPQSDFKLLWGNKEIMESGDTYIKNYVAPNNNRLMGFYLKRANIMVLRDGAIEKGVEIETFAHEFQHYLFDNNTPLFGPMTKRYRAIHPYNPEEYARINKNTCSTPNFERDLRDLLEPCKTDIRSRKDLIKYYAENTNLTSKERLEAYITSICRYHFCRSISSNVGKLINQIINLRNEFNSYKVMDMIVKYKDKNATGHMKNALLYKEAIRVMKREIFKILTHQHPICSRKVLANRKLPSPVIG